MGTHAAGHSPGWHHSGEEGITWHSWVCRGEGIIQGSSLDPWPQNHTSAWLVSDQLVLSAEAHQGSLKVQGAASEGGGAANGSICPGHVTCPHCLHQVSVNPAYQAMELEYALKKVGPFLGYCGRSQLVPSTGGFQLSQKAERGGGHAQGTP